MSDCCPENQDQCGAGAPHHREHAGGIRIEGEEDDPRGAT
jgi:hypothetical protein